MCIRDRCRPSLNKVLSESGNNCDKHAERVPALNNSALLLCRFVFVFVFVLLVFVHFTTTKDPGLLLAQGGLLG